MMISIGGRRGLYIVDTASLTRAQEMIAQSSGVDFVIGDSNVVWNFDLGIDQFTLPIYFLKQAREIAAHSNLITDFTTEHCFNFMINKKMIHRYLTARLVEYFGLESYDYTYSGSCVNINDARIFQDLDICDPDRATFTKQTMMEILGDVTIPTRFLSVDFDSAATPKLGQIAHYGGNLYAWHAGLDKIFQSSMVSLVTEADDNNYELFDFSEKTVYAILGLTMPIWPGAPRHAEQFESLGFDAFHDIIDHGYQHESTLFMRCYRALADNLKLLTDLSHAQKLRQSIKPRLIDNRLNLLHGVEKYCSDRLEQWPSYVREAYRQCGLWAG
jgi:hypothetical protein